MNKRLITVLKIMLVAAFILGIFVVGRQSSDYKKGQQDYDEAEKLAKLPTQSEISSPSAKTVLSEPAAEDPYAAMLKENIDLAALREVNSDVVGWIDIPGTELSYPVLQGKDNSYYLNHTWKKESNSVGSVFLECQVDPGLADYNTIIYGHRMRDFSMFGSLKNYTDISYWEENPSVYVVIDGEAYRYDIYAAYKADPEDIVYGLKIRSRPKKQELIQFGLENSVIETGIEPTTFDRILTLSTCTGNGHASRWVVQAVYHVEASNSLGSNESNSEGADDAADASIRDSEDSLTFDASTVKERREFEMLDKILRIVLLTGATLILTVLIAAIILQYCLRKKRQDEKKS